MEDTQNRIEAERVVELMLDDVFQVHNQANGNGYTILLDGKRKKVKTTDDLVSVMYKNSNVLQSDEVYQTFIKYINYHSNEDRKSFEDTWKKYVKLMVQDHIQKKAQYRDKITEESIPSAFGAKFTPCTFLPRETINDKDLQILKGLAFCPSSQFFFFEFHGNWTRLGTALELQSKSSISSIKAAILISKANAERRGVEKWDIWDEHYKECDKLTSEFMEIRSVLEQAIKEKIPLDINIRPYWMDEDTTIRKFLQLPDDALAFDPVDKLHSAFCKAAVNKVLSAVMVNNGLGTINFEQDGEFFKRYSFRSKNNCKCHLPEYLCAVFQEIPSLISEIPSLKEEPAIITDIPGAMARFSIQDNWLEDLPEGQKELKECEATKSFLRPYTQNEQLALMSYAYTVIHPSTNDPINLCVKTGGGTFKTSTFAGNLIDLLNYAYRPDGSIVHKMVGDTWVKDSARLENANGDGVSTAALVFNDECTENSINKFKDMSGGSTDSGVDYQRRVMRENPTQMKIYAKWLFLTNLDFQIQDTEGAFDRRLGIIDEMKIKKLKAPYPRESYQKERKKELKAFYELSKKCYEKVVEKYGSLTSFFQECPELNKNLRQAYNEEGKILTYYQIWKYIENTNQTSSVVNDQSYKKFSDGSYGVSKKEADSVLDSYCKVNGINLAGMKKWMQNTESCTATNNMKCKMRFCGGDLSWGYRLYPLKKEFIPDDDFDSSEEVDKVNDIH